MSHGKFEMGVPTDSARHDLRGKLSTSSNSSLQRRRTGKGVPLLCRGRIPPIPLLGKGRLGEVEPSSEPRGGRAQLLRGALRLFVIFLIGGLGCGGSSQDPLDESVMLQKESLQLADRISFPKLIDWIAPAIVSIDSPAQGSQVASPVTISGKIRDNRMGLTITVNGKEATLTERVFPPLWPKTYQFVAEDVDISQGSAVIVARDEAGRHDSYLLLFTDDDGDGLYDVEHATGNPIIIDFHAELDGQTVTEFDRDRELTFSWEIDNFESPVSLRLIEKENPYLDCYRGEWVSDDKVLYPDSKGSTNLRPKTPGGVVEFELEAISEDPDDIDGDGITEEIHRVPLSLQVLGDPQIYAFTSGTGLDLCASPLAAAEAGLPTYLSGSTVPGWYWKIANADRAVIEETWNEFASEGVLQTIDVSDQLPSANGNFDITPKTLAGVSHFTLTAWSVDEEGRVEAQTQTSLELEILAQTPEIDLALTNEEGEPLETDGYGLWAIDYPNNVDDPSDSHYKAYPVKLSWNVTDVVERVTVYVSNDTLTEDGFYIGQQGRVVFESEVPQPSTSGSIIFYPEGPVTFTVAAEGPGGLGPGREGVATESVILNVRRQPPPITPIVSEFTLSVNGESCVGDCYAFEGDVATLTYDVSDAKSLDITESVGTHYLPEGGIHLEGEKASGRRVLELPVLNDSTVFTIVAVNNGGRESLSRILSVTPIPVPEITFALEEDGDQDHIIEVGESETITLDFKVNYATDVEIRSPHPDFETVTIHNNDFRDTIVGEPISFPLEQSTSFTLVASGPGGSQTAVQSIGYYEPIQSAPNIVEFKVTPSLLTEGETVTLEWHVEDETGAEVTIEIRDAASAPSSLDGSPYLTTELDGTLEVSGIIQSNNFVLIADNGENTDTEIRDVIVVSPEPPEITFEIDTAEGDDDIIDPGESPIVALSWRVDNADTMEIYSSDPNFESVVVVGHDSDYPIQDSLEFETTGTTSFLLIASGPGGTEDRVKSVGYGGEIPSPPWIDYFEVRDATCSSVVDLVEGGETVCLFWKVTGATGIEIRDATNFYSSIDRDCDGSCSPSEFEGSMLVDDFFEPQVFTLIARNVGGIASQQVPLEVLTDFPKPVISFDVDRAYFEGTPGTPTLSWTVEYAQEVHFIASDPDLTLPAGYPLTALNALEPVSGSVSYTLDHTVTFAIMAIGPGGSSVQYLSVGVESEPLAPPVVEYFIADPPRVWAKTPITLSWSVTGAEEIWIEDAANRQSSIDGGVSVAPQGTLTVDSLFEPQTFTLYARNADNLVIAQASVEVLISGQLLATYDVTGVADLTEYNLGTRDFYMIWDVVVAGRDAPAEAELEVYAFLQDVAGFSVPEPNEFEKVAIVPQWTDSSATFDILQIPIPLPIPNTDSYIDLSATGWIHGASTGGSIGEELPMSIDGTFAAWKDDIEVTGTVRLERRP